mmetsp:Transcript_27057/g.33184  ORF Transcript_27057/g.33184 Transcript_27057/m.33184 type:complete len:223 (+) Transcript_27057:66-734(+)|eukprot:CAMPEP_0194355060 /NCGR_PEP_ID=MMETSP0174-20130528/3034_1 /TAXON_ID=216777 /ORGANISM="Proboscia alata, Strain PI-D3" /LENGTH=222 /DNA_ID=CAMNT_0039124187 /DNA_START=52 /DNA_END=720 /DNA_ORIENTATION=-
MVLMLKLITQILLPFSTFLMAHADSIRVGVSKDDECAVVETVSPFDIEVFISAPWYIHKQAVRPDSPLEWNYCTQAIYNQRNRSSFPWGYTIDVNNYAEDLDGNVFGGPLCATVDRGEEEDSSKLAVAPCFIPKLLTGPYWVVYYDESKGYALISGGQPNRNTGDGCTGKSRTGNNSGLWIFLRTTERDDEKIAEVKQLAIDAGFDTSILNDVIHKDCSYDQ